jgi:hypothetical protein
MEPNCLSLVLAGIMAVGTMMSAGSVNRRRCDISPTTLRELATEALPMLFLDGR